MKKLLVSFAIVAAAFGLLAAPVSAAFVTLTWTGETDFFGNDGLGIFVPAGPVPQGTPYTATYVYDTSISFQANPIIGAEVVEGGVFFNPARPVPLVSAAVTINGSTLDMDGGYDSHYLRQSGQGASQISTLAQRLIDGNPQPFGGELFQRIFRGGDFYGLPLELPGEFAIDASDNPGGEVLFFNRDALGNLDGPTTQIRLIPSHLSITSVPEPGSLALVISGLCCLLGGLVCRLRRT